ncbi:glycosyltransferase [Dyadobacter sp. CY312]|uniref:glycosyltransferase n=1 Tax=Dyadobacter sp. CY312 TaxID=2907303 RepID=UPI001F3AE686|nr:glycosyltransferase [Dyadobacter sp. CY312]MCE7040132.1 glycosyl transferase [Dyadobacter sp. CY312]
MQTDQIDPKADLKILIAPLDWGLGHATRCIPVIRHLIQSNCKVVLAGEGAVAQLLKSNFPDLEILPLPGYRISYSNTASGFVPKILVQIPKIIRAIKAEKRWLKQIQTQHHFDLVISDNRYGLKIKRLPSVIMTHQLQIQSGTGTLSDQMLKWLHYRILEKFDACWVVDNEGINNLGGSLSHPAEIPSNAKYIGLLSQLDQMSTANKSDQKEILVLLSGPEPMRSILEQQILTQLKTATEYHFNLVAGNPTGSVPDKLPDHVTYYTHLNAEKINELMQKASLVICRSGYSTLMDLVMMNKKALVIPTPGQTEQEYLGKRLLDKGLLFCQNQTLLNLADDIPEALKFPGFKQIESQNNFRVVVNDVLNQLRIH